MESPGLLNDINEEQFVQVNDLVNFRDNRNKDEQFLNQQLWENNNNTILEESFNNENLQETQQLKFNTTVAFKNMNYNGQEDYRF